MPPVLPSRLVRIQCAERSESRDEERPLWTKKAYPGCDFGVKPYQVTLTKGHYQPRKTVQIQGVSPEELEIRLAALGDAE